MLERRKSVSLLVVAFWLLIGTSSNAQTNPAPTPASGGFDTRPLVPAAGEATPLLTR